MPTAVRTAPAPPATGTPRRAWLFVRITVQIHHVTDRTQPTHCAPRCRKFNDDITSCTVGRSPSRRSQTVQATRIARSAPRADIRPRRKAASIGAIDSRGNLNRLRRTWPGTSALVVHPSALHRCAARALAPATRAATVALLSVCSSPNVAPACPCIWTQISMRSSSGPDSLPR